MAGTGQVTQAPPRAAGAAVRRRSQARARCRRVSRPSHRGPDANGFPASSSRWQDARGAWAAEYERGASSKPSRADAASAAGGDVFQAEWLDACKGKSNNVCTAPAARRTAISITPEP